MAERGQQRDGRLDTPLERGRWFGGRTRGGSAESDTAGVLSERIARFLGTPSFIIWLTVFCVAWLLWNTLAIEEWRFDAAERGFTALTLMLSLQASYAAPLILLAQNRQTDRDRIAAEQDRQRTERNLADTEYLAREMASLRMALQDVATRDYVRGELRDLLDALREDIRTEVRAELRAELHGEERVDEPAGKRTDRRKKKRPSPPEHADAGGVPAGEPAPAEPEPTPAEPPVGEARSGPGPE